MVALGERSIPNGQELLAEFIQYGRQQPFEEIVRRYAGMVFNVCYRITKDKHEAEDATQAVFLTLALQAKRGTEIKALGPWLQQVGKRLALDNRRSKKRRATREERHQTETTARREALLDDTLPSADLDELKTVLHEELQKLPTKYRLPLILHYFGGLSRDEMAAELNCKPSTLGVRIFRGREMLAGRLSSRGIHISAAMLATALGFYVRRAVSETLIASTSHAATAMMAGHDGAGLASAHVIGLTRRAGSAMAIGKVKIAALSLILASTSLGAGAKALDMLPQINVQRLISDSIKRLVHPLMQPFSSPLRVEAPTNPAKTNIAATPSPSADPSLVLNLGNVIARVNPAAKPAAMKAATDASLPNDSGLPVNVATATSSANWADNAPARSWSTRTNSTSAASIKTTAASAAAGSVKTADESDGSTSIASASASGAAGGSTGIASDYHPSTPLPSRSSTSTTTHATNVVLTMNDLFVGSGATTSTKLASSDSSSTAAVNPSASPTALIQIPSIGGTVTQSSRGVVRGWGIIDRTGTLQVSGKVVADGQGVDRTLNLTSFSCVKSASDSSYTPSQSSGSSINAVAGVESGESANMVTSPAAASNPGPVQLIEISPDAKAAANVSQGFGWYAINHGRLSLPLMASSTDPKTLTWGDGPDANLSLVNSVRIALKTDGAATLANTQDPTPHFLSLLASDRTDVPSLYELNGATIGLWQVDPNSPALAAADLTVRYNSTLIDQLGAPESSLELWTYGSSLGAWQPVDPSSFALDTADSLVSGYGSDIRYFAVTVDTMVGHDLNELVASNLTQVSGRTLIGNEGATSNSQSVPEPVIGLPLLAIGAGLLGRRRRNRVS